MTETPTQDEAHSAPDDAAAAPKRRGLRKRDAAWALLSGLVGFAAVLALGFVVLVGRDLRAPDWLQQDVQARLAEAVPDLDIGIGQIALRIERSDLSPRIFLQNVVVRDETGLPFASLTELSVRASFRAALQGQLLPKKVTLTGALVKLRRSADGSFDFTIGSALQSSGQAPTLAALLDRLDTLLVRDELARLTELRAEALTLLYEDARAGRAWTVDGGRVSLTRAGDAVALRADFALLGGQDYATTLELTYDSAIGSPAGAIGLQLADAPSADIASQDPALAWMSVLRAPISGALRTSVDDAGSFGRLDATLQIGAGALQPDVAARPVPFDGARAYFSFDPSVGLLDFTELTVQSAWLNATASARARLEGLDAGWPTALTAQLQVSEVSANPLGLYDTPVTLDRATADLRIQLDPFKMTLGQLVLEEDGQIATARGTADIGRDGWNAALDASAAKVDPELVMSFWPATAKTRTRDWITSNLIEAEIRDARFALRIKPDHRPDMHLSLRYSDATVRYMKEMPFVTQASGSVQLEAGRLVVVADSGIVRPDAGGPITIDGTSFEIPDTRVRGGPAKVAVFGSGSVTSVLELLDAPRFGFLSRANLGTDLATGQAVFDGTIDFSLKPKVPISEIDFDISATVRQAESTTLLQGRRLASSRLQITAQPDAVTIEGPGTLDDIPFDGIFTLPLGPERAAAGVIGTVELSQKAVTAFNIGLPPGTVNGTGKGQITLSLPRGAAPEFSLTSNLSGIGLSIAPIGWSHGQRATGTLEVNGVLGTPGGERPRVDQFRLQASGLRAEGSVTIASNGALDVADFNRVRIGDWLDSRVTLTGRGANVPPRIGLRGGRLDVRGLSASGGTSSAGTDQFGALPLSLNIAELRITEAIALNDFSAELTSQRGLAGQFTGRLGGRTPISGIASRQNGATAFRITGQNAGAALQDAGLLRSANEGNLSLALAPTGAPGTYDGTLSIANMRLGEPPNALALLSAASGIGLLEQIDGRGLMFAQIESRFRLAPQTITIFEGSAVGPSLGLSADGFFNTATGQLDLQGVVSPLYAINGIGAILTRRGEGLIGMGYTADGPVSQPRVRVNPLSLFTPGMFREIFRRPPPQISQ